MTKLWVPPAVETDLAERTRQANTELLAMFELRGPVQSEWNPELSRLDPHLRLGKASMLAQWPGVLPGYWHLLIDVPTAPISVLPIHGPNLEFVEPTIHILDKLRRGDLQDPRVERDMRDAQARDVRAKERQAARDAEDRNDEVVERWKAATQTRVSMSRDAPWSQSVKGLKKKPQT